ncbi:hypothetical protein QFC22_000645 [Naganishia vaughanmartiniae]|uniref:Uncharacterized protein n=1 Tax=Naganishia vaughanmartiniae TaxID=1424756 RepID=A0ACC2XP92_9TREE|nr:hypothetical protein QFC22_000645 [Naganishia vaughanmartiniae]
MASVQSTVAQPAPTETPVTVVIAASNLFTPPLKPQVSIAFTSRGTAGAWYEDGIHYQTLQDPGPSSTTYGPELWKARRAAWLLGDLELNPAAPKVAMSSEEGEEFTFETSSIHTRDSCTGATTPTSSIAGNEDNSKPLMSTIQQLSAKARGKLPSFLHLSYTNGTAPPEAVKPRDSPTPGTAPALSSLDKLELLMAEPGADENEKVWRQGGLEAVWRMLTDSKTLKQPMRLGLVIQILKAGWIRDGTWPSSLAKDGRTRRAVAAVIDDPFFQSPPPSPTLQAVAAGEGAVYIEQEYNPPKRL